MRETTGAVFDTLAQIHLIRGEHEEAEPLPANAPSEAYGEYGAPDARWYQWSLRVLEARLALRRGEPRARARAGQRRRAMRADAPAAYALQAELIAIEALLASGASGESAGAARGVADADPAGRDERHVGRIPPPARPPPRRRRPRDRGVPRLRPERQRLRAARRALPGRARAIWSSGGWPRRPARGRGRPAI